MILGFSLVVYSTGVKSAKATLVAVALSLSPAKAEPENAAREAKAVPTAKFRAFFLRCMGNRRQNKDESV